jgi:hypothetical protein
VVDDAVEAEDDDRGGEDASGAGEFVRVKGAPHGVFVFKDVDLTFGTSTLNMLRVSTRFTNAEDIILPRGIITVIPFSSGVDVVLPERTWFCFRVNSNSAVDWFPERRRYF